MIKLFGLVATLIFISLYCNVESKIVFDPLKFTSHASQEIAFLQFIKDFNKSYETESEFIHRFAVFKNNTLKAMELDEASKKIGGARFGVTKFSDLTTEEFRSGWLMPNMPAIPKEKFGPQYQLPNNTKLSVNAPSSFDWRSHPNRVTGVYNQGQCGSCWAFSATENHESRYALQHNQNVQSMSVQQVVDCDDPSQHACNGGWPYLAWDYIYYQGGQDSWGCYPYVGRYEGCRWNAGCNVGSLISWTWIFPGQENNMAAWLYGNAPISICVDATQWQFYTHGIMLSGQCGRQTDHCVLITGYDVASNPAYWIVRNSWGPDWGESGYIQLQYGGNTCDLAQYPASCHTVNGN